MQLSLDKVLQATAGKLIVERFMFFFVCTKGVRDEKCISLTTNNASTA